MYLSEIEYQELEVTQKKIVNKTASSAEMKNFLKLIEKSGNMAELSNYANSMGFNSMNDFKKHLNNKAKNENLTKGLAIVGSAILLALMLSK